MRKKQASAKKKKSSAKGHVFSRAFIQRLTKGDLKRVGVFSCAVFGLVLFVALVLFLTRPKLLWHVDEDFAVAWQRALNEAPPPFSRFEVLPRTGDEPFPRNRFGFVISRNGPQGESIEGVPAVLFRDLARSRTYDGWSAIALNPWLVFYKHRDPEPSRSILNNANQRGSLLLAGSDRGAVQAWLLQLLQESPGVFVSESEAWEEKAIALPREYPMQSGASSYAWVQVWPMLFRDEIAYLYAPLSQARALPAFRAGLLHAARFPEPSGWDRYGLQAEVLWAKGRGRSKGQKEKIAALESWLATPQTQTIIANNIEWIPAHPSGVPYNTVSWVARQEWLRSAFIWQGADGATDR